jgi:hypothetical protein
MKSQSSLALSRKLFLQTSIGLGITCSAITVLTVQGCSLHFQNVKELGLPTSKAEEEVIAIHDYFHQTLNEEFFGGVDGAFAQPISLISLEGLSLNNNFGSEETRKMRFVPHPFSLPESVLPCSISATGSLLSSETSHLSGLLNYLSMVLVSCPINREAIISTPFLSGHENSSPHTRAITTGVPTWDLLKASHLRAPDGNPRIVNFHLG